MNAVGCDAMAAAKTVTSTKAGHGSAGATVAGMTRLTATCIAEAIAIAAAMVATRDETGKEATSAAAERDTRPVIDVAHADATKSRIRARIRPARLSAKVSRTVAKSSLMAAPC